MDLRLLSWQGSDVEWWRFASSGSRRARRVLSAKSFLRVWLGVTLCVLTTPRTQAQERNREDAPPQSTPWQPFAEAEAPGVTATRHLSSVRLSLDDQVQSPVRIPRLAAALRTLEWQGEEASQSDLELKPEQDEWIISWGKSAQPKDRQILIELEATAQLLGETSPVQPGADGSVYLPAHLAFSSGEKIRYEPQPHKNTVGYWTGANDQAMWRFQLDRSGAFNVAILQGCGKGQGGSRASLAIEPADVSSQSTVPAQVLRFEVLETGHFQNFQWRHLGRVELADSGSYELTIRPEEIAKAALMDVRAVHLVRLPAAKR